MAFQRTAFQNDAFQMPIRGVARTILISYIRRYLNDIVSGTTSTQTVYASSYALLTEDAEEILIESAP